MVRAGESRKEENISLSLLRHLLRAQYSGNSHVVERRSVHSVVVGVEGERHVEANVGWCLSDDLNWTHQKIVEEREVLDNESCRLLSGVGVGVRDRGSDGCKERNKSQFRRGK